MTEKRTALVIIVSSFLVGGLILLFGTWKGDDSGPASQRTTNSSTDPPASTLEISVELQTSKIAQSTNVESSQPAITALDGTPLDVTLDIAVSETIEAETAPTIMQESSTSEPAPTIPLVTTTAGTTVPETTVPAPEMNLVPGTYETKSVELTTSTTAATIVQAGLLEQAESFAREFYTFSEEDTLESWKARVGIFATADLKERLVIDAFDPGISISATIKPLEEATGVINANSADVTIIAAISQFENKNLVKNLDLPIYLVLVRQNGSIWLVADYSFYL